MASRQADQVITAAMVDAEGNIDECDRRNIAFCPIEDVEYVLQNGTADSFLDACDEVSSGEKKGLMLSVAHIAIHDQLRSYPFKDRIADLLPWMAEMRAQADTASNK